MEDSSIVARIRADGFAAGVASQKSHQSQMSQVEYDAAYISGRDAAWEQAPSRLMWLITGMLLAALIIFAYLAVTDNKQSNKPCWDGVAKPSPNGYQHKRYAWYDFKSSNYCPRGWYKPTNNYPILRIY